MKKIMFIFLLVLTLCLAVSCSSSTVKEVTIHVPYVPEEPTKSSEWQTTGLYILQATGPISYCTDPESKQESASVKSSSKATEVTVKYNVGDTIYDVLTDDIFVFDSKRVDEKEVNEFVPLFVHMVRYGIQDLYMSTTGFGENVFEDWNLPVTTKDLYICFDYKKK